MSKEFIPYEQALALKELGFDEPCVASYFFPQLQSLKYTPTWMQNSTLNMGDDGCTAPLYQQAFRWFREKHDLGHMINGIGHESFIMNIGGVLHIFNAFDFETYEEAELACLIELIEIVKNK